MLGILFHLLGLFMLSEFRLKTSSSIVIVGVSKERKTELGLFGYTFRAMDLIYLLALLLHVLHVLFTSSNFCGY